MQQICSRYAADMQQICSRYAADMQQICSRYAADMKQICTCTYSKNLMCAKCSHVVQQLSHGRYIS